MVVGWRKFSTQSFDWVLMVAVLFMVALGLEAIYSVDLSRGVELQLFKRQLVAAAIGLGLVVLVSMLQFTVFRSTAKLWYVASVVLLVAVLFFGKTINSTTGWFRIAGFSFQPVEFAKIGVILMLAYIVANFGRHFERLLFFLGTGLVTGLVMVLVLLQPDLGSAVLIGLIWLGLMLLVGARKLHLLLLLGGFIIMSLLAWEFLLKDYQRDRLKNFINPERDRGTSGYNVTQAMVAVGSGKLLGRGLGFGSQSQLRFLPEAQTDFIFSVVAEELGFAGVVVLFVLFGIVCWRLLIIVKNSQDDFVVATVSGITLVLFSQFFINIGAEVGIVPVTGVTVPFISYGGSSLIINLLMIGIAQSMIVRRY
jgi:rod shape determining protein RodA